VAVVGSSTAEIVGGLESATQQSATQQSATQQLAAEANSTEVSQGSPSLTFPEAPQHLAGSTESAPSSTIANPPNGATDPTDPENVAEDLENVLETSSWQVRPWMPSTLAPRMRPGFSIRNSSSIPELSWA
jgi:hypothetical protein